MITVLDLVMVVLTNLIVLIILGFLIACLGHTVQKFMEPGMIFNPYGVWISKLSQSSKFGNYISKPLGMCIYCNTTWLALGVYIIIPSEYVILFNTGLVWYEITMYFLYPILLIGVTMFFIDIITKIKK